jgi:hypothetical protein
LTPLRHYMSITIQHTKLKNYSNLVGKKYRDFSHSISLVILLRSEKEKNDKTENIISVITKPCHRTHQMEQGSSH